MNKILIKFLIIIWILCK